MRFFAVIDSCLVVVLTLSFSTPYAGAQSVTPPDCLANTKADYDACVLNQCGSPSCSVAAGGFGTCQEVDDFCDSFTKDCCPQCSPELTAMADCAVPGCNIECKALNEVATPDCLPNTQKAYDDCVLNQCGSPSCNVAASGVSTCQELDGFCDSFTKECCPQCSSQLTDLANCAIADCQIECEALKEISTTATAEDPSSSTSSSELIPRSSMGTIALLIVAIMKLSL